MVLISLYNLQGLSRKKTSNICILILTYVKEYILLLYCEPESCSWMKEISLSKNKTLPSVLRREIVHEKHFSYEILNKNYDFQQNHNINLNTQSK